MMIMLHFDGRPNKGNKRKIQIDCVSLAAAWDCISWVPRGKEAHMIKAKVFRCLKHGWEANVVDFICTLRVRLVGDLASSILQKRKLGNQIWRTCHSKLLSV